MDFGSTTKIKERQKNKGGAHSERGRHEKNKHVQALAQRQRGTRMIASEAKNDHGPCS